MQGVLFAFTFLARVSFYSDPKYSAHMPKYIRNTFAPLLPVVPSSSRP